MNAPAPEPTVPEGVPERPAYLTVAEVADALGIHRRTAWRRAILGDLPTLRLSTRLLRIEARAVLGPERAARPWPDHAPVQVEIGWLADLWRVSPSTLVRMARDGELPLQQRRRTWVGDRRRVLSFVIDHTTEEPP